MVLGLSPVAIYSKLSYLSVGKKSTSPPNSFTRCCKRNRKTCYFGKFKHAWPHTPKMIIAIWRNLWHLSVRKRSLSSFMLSLRYYKDIVNLLFWVLWACLAVQTQRDTITFRKLSFLLGGKKSTSPNPILFCRYCKDMQTTHFEYFQHAWLHTPKMIVPTWRRFGCLSACQNILHLSLLSWDITFSRILQLDWLTAFWSITWGPQFSRIWDWWWNISNNISFNFKLLPRETNDRIFQKIQKVLGPFWGPFCANFGQKWIFLDKSLLWVFRYSNCLPSCQQSERTIESFLRKTLNWYMDRLTDGQLWFYSTLHRTGSKKRIISTLSPLILNV